MPQVVIVSEAADGRGGASLASIRSAQALVEEGLQAHFFAASGPIHEGLNGIRTQVLADGYDLMQVSPLRRATQSLWNADAAQAFARFVAGLEPRDTIIHVHSFHIQLTASVPKQAMELGFPVVLSVHDYAAACPYSGFYNYNTGTPCGKRALSFGCATTLCNESRSVPGKLWHVEKGLVQRGRGGIPSGLDHLIFPTIFSRKILESYLPPETPTSIVRNPMDVPQGLARQLVANAPFLFVGRLTHEKGGLLLAEASKRAGVPVQFVGEGPLEEEIRRANPNAQLLGWQSSGAVYEAMRQARALVFPSRLYETQGMSVLEAQAIGLPAIVSDVCASTEFVEHGANGLIFRSGEASSLTACLEEMSDDAAAARLGQAAYDAYWQDPPTTKAHARELLKVYEHVRTKRGSP